MAGHHTLTAVQDASPTAVHRAQPTAAVSPPRSSASNLQRLIDPSAGVLSIPAKPAITAGKANLTHLPPPVWPNLSNRPLTSSSPSLHMMEAAPAQETAMASCSSPVAHNHPASPNPQAQSSYAQLVDPNEGNELKFVPTQTINGICCTQIEKN